MNKLIQVSKLIQPQHSGPSAFIRWGRTCCTDSLISYMYKTLLVSDIGNDTNTYSMYPHCHYMCIIMESTHFMMMKKLKILRRQKIIYAERQNIWAELYIQLSCGNLQIFVIEHFTMRISIVWDSVQHDTRQVGMLVVLATVSSLPTHKMTSSRSAALGYSELTTSSYDDIIAIVCYVFCPIPDNMWVANFCCGTKPYTHLTLGVVSQGLRPLDTSTCCSCSANEHVFCYTRLTGHMLITQHIWSHDAANIV